jgi:hypothetical protein
MILLGNPQDIFARRPPSAISVAPVMSLAGAFARSRAGPTTFEGSGQRSRMVFLLSFACRAA